MTELLRLETLPIINENDTVAVDELIVGDNDNLAAHVAVLADADLLVICTDIDGLYDADPRSNSKAKHIPVVKKIDQTIRDLAGGANEPLAIGGMRTKLQAAEIAASRGIDTIILDGTNRLNLDKLLRGEQVGTLFERIESPMTAKKHWMLHALQSDGKIFVDQGAAKALQVKGASLLPSGILKVEGDFTAGDAATIVTMEKVGTKEIAKGISQYDSRDLRKIQGRKSSEIEDLLGFFTTDVVVHRNDLVLL